MMPPDFDPGPLSHVEQSSDGTRATLVFVRHLRHVPSRVWRVLTEPEEVRQWAPFDPDRNLAAEGPATLRMTDGHTVETFAADVRSAVAPRLLEYTWGDDLLRWELEPEGNGTRLTLRHTVESPEWMPRTAAGWHLCLVVAERFLDNAPIGRIVGRDAKKYGWERLHDAYARALGIEGKGWPDEVFSNSEAASSGPGDGR